MEDEDDIKQRNQKQQKMTPEKEQVPLGGRWPTMLLVVKITRTVVAEEEQLE